MAPSTLTQSAISSNPDVVISVDTYKVVHVAVALAAGQCAGGIRGMTN
jgi:hypothetical protein